MEQLGPFKKNLPLQSKEAEKKAKILQDLFLWHQPCTPRPPIFAGVSALALASQICVQHLC